eukprot:Hpha_TRINITY_DN13400_c0_g1::TRINITY_DN13400_c0_g1_i1::g.130888::m.130888
MSPRVGMLCVLFAAVHARDTATCERRRLCNGAALCDNVCTPGTIEIDTWTDSALAFQRRLQRNEPLVRATLIGTHNSAITQAYGYGIEQDVLEDLTGTPLYTGDDLGEGVCNSHSVLDQLRLGLRHIEIDITAGYFRAEPNKIFVCHTPAPVDKYPLQIEESALKKGLKLGNWSASRLSCLGTRMPLTDMLHEIKGWVDANPEEVVILYLDIKPLTVDDKAQVRALNADITSVFGDSIWTPEDGSPLGVKMGDFVAKGKRVIFEARNKGVQKVSPQLVFYPSLWNQQFGSTKLASFPNCSIGGVEWYTPINAPTPGMMVRGLSFGTANANRSSPGSDTGGERAQQCGLSIVSGNYIQPQDLTTYVWSWAEGEPAGSEGCIAVNSTSGRWSVRECAQAGPLACRAVNDDTNWSFAANCPADRVAAPPTNGFANQHLTVAAKAAGHSWVRVNTTIN